MHGQYPICVVSVQCPPDQVDVNIHPTKSAVKFVDAKTAFRVVHYALREAIEKAPWSEGRSPVRPRVPEVTVPSERFSEPALNQTQFKQKSTFPGHPHNPNPQPGDRPTLEQLKAAAVRDTEQALDQALASTREEQAPQGEDQTAYWSNLQVIGQVDLTYIVCQDGQSMVLVDQHAAHERVAFERLMRGWRQGQVEVQPMLLPITFDLEESEVEALLTVSSDLQKMGIELERAGPASLAISSLPSIIKEKGVVESLRQLADDINEKGGSFALETAIGDICATMACHSVIRAGQALSLEEMQALLRDMDEFPLSGFCPHGRSVSLEFSFAQLEKDFGRRV
jgi:DNA mismatch repair protein MutL